MDNVFLCLSTVFVFSTINIYYGQNKNECLKGSDPPRLKISLCSRRYWQTMHYWQYCECVQGTQWWTLRKNILNIYMMQRPVGKHTHEGTNQGMLCLHRMWLREVVQEIRKRRGRNIWLRKGLYLKMWNGAGLLWGSPKAFLRPPVPSWEWRCPGREPWAYLPGYPLNICQDLKRAVR